MTTDERDVLRAVCDALDEARGYLPIRRGVLTERDRADVALAAAETLLREPVPADSSVKANRLLTLLSSGPQTCRGATCGSAVWWVTTRSGKPMPLDADLTPHWATCPDAASFRAGRR